MMGCTRPGLLISDASGGGARVLKYPLALESVTSLVLPPDAPILKIAEQHGGIMLWAVMRQDRPTEPPMEKRHFYVVGTGDLIPSVCHTYHDSVFIDQYVLHVFEGFR
jgi:hypothetical protein